AGRSNDGRGQRHVACFDAMVVRAKGDCLSARPNKAVRSLERRGRAPRGGMGCHWQILAPLLAPVSAVPHTGAGMPGASARAAQASLRSANELTYVARDGITRHCYSPWLRS